MDPYRSDCSKAAQAAEATAGSLDKDKQQHSSRQCPPVPKTLLPEEVRASNFLDLPGVKLPNIRGSQNVVYTTEIREKRMIEKEVHKFYDNKSAHTSCEAALYQEWLLQEDTQTTPRQERLKKYRYGDLLHGEFYKAQHVTEKRNAVRMKEQERQHRNYIRRKLDLCKQIEDKWKEKEMLLLTKIGEEIRREEKIEEQRRKTREEIVQKKRAFMEKKIARHLEHMKRHAIKRAGQENTFSSKGQDEAEACPKLKKITDATIGQKSRQGPQEQKRTIHYHDCTNKVPAKKPAISFSEREVQSSATQEKVPPVKEIQKEANLPSKSVLKKQNTQKNKEMTSKSHPVNIKELKRASSHTADCTKTANVSRQSKQHIQKGEKSHADVSRRKSKKSQVNHKSEHVKNAFMHRETEATINEMSPATNSSTTKQWDNCQNLCQEKVTFEELNSTIHNIMAWVVASVTSVLYPVITNSEERVQSNTYPVSAESAPSLDGASCCHTGSDMMIYTRTKTFQRKPYAEAFDRSVEQPTTALIPSSFSKVRTPGKAQSKKNSFMPAKIKFNEALEYPDLKLYKSDTQLFVSTECKTKKFKNAATETANLEDSLSSDGETKDKNEKQELVNAFADFKYYIKEETELILQKIFEELMFNLTETIPTLSTAVTDHFFDQTDKDSEKLLDDIDISTAADEIVGTILEKLKYAAEKKCIKAFPQDLSVHFKSDSAPSEEHSICCKEVHSEASLPYYFENMGNLTEDIVHVNSQKLMLLAPFKQNQLADLEDIPKSSYQLHMKDPTYTFFQQIGKKKSSAESEADSLTAEGEIQSFVSNILSHSSLLVNLEEVISTTLDFVQMGLNDERLTATKETVLILQLLDDILTQLQ